MRKTLFVIFVFAAMAAIAAAQAHPTLDGTWYMDKARSHYPAQSAIETIHQKDQVIDITVDETPGRPGNPMQLHLSADSKPMVSTVGPNKFTSKTHWEGSKLVTFVEGDRGQHMTETRELSSDGSTLTVTGYHQDELTKPYYVRVMTKNMPDHGDKPAM